ncbi:MAG: electron transport complex subunit E [Clostridiales bacterium]|nr:electron transport complex subunit E [Clostridiales bacterium]
MNTRDVLINGLWRENPTFRMLLGMCPTLAVTTAAINGVGMGLAATAVLLCSNVFVSLLRNFIPREVRIPAYILIIASFTTIVQLVLKAFAPALDAALGLYIPLIAVNCIILARAEAFAGNRGPWLSAMDGIGMGLGFTLALTVLASIRELVGAGTLFGAPVAGASFEPLKIALMTPGGFITLGLLLGGMNFATSLKMKKKKGAREHELHCAACPHSDRCGVGQ